MKRLFGNFFEDKKVLITGHTGFIGSWLSIMLNELSAKVIGYSLPPYTNKDNFIVSNLEQKLVHIIGDVRDFNKVKEVFNKYKPDIVFHLAAQPIVRMSYEIPKDTYDINIGGTVNIFEAFRTLESCKILINFTTDKIYENLELDRGYHEKDRIGGYDPYSSSKACSDLITSAYRTSFFNNNLNNNSKCVSSVRCGNIIGGGDWQQDRLIPDCMKAILKNQEIGLRNPHSVRPWQHVFEPLRGMLMLTIKMWEENNKFSDAWNFGPLKDVAYSTKDIVEKIITWFGKGGYKILMDQSSDELHETKQLLLDSTKANKLLGWLPILTIDETIDYSCKWYANEKIDYNYNVEQVNNYVDKCR